MELSDLQRSQSKISIADKNGAINMSNNELKSSFSEWVSRCGHEFSPTEPTTFIDDDGIQRYLSNWYEVKETDKLDVKTQFDTTGCISIPIECTGSDKVEKLYIVDFLMDFRTLWTYLEEDNIDEVAEYSPLFRIYMEVYFHPRTMQLMIALTTYYILVTGIAYESFPSISVFSQVISYLYIASAGAVYISLAFLLKGYISTKQEERVENKAVKHMNRTTNKKNTMRAIQWIHYIKESIRATISEVTRLYQGDEQHLQHGPGIEDRSVPFYQALNIAMKFLSKRKIPGNDKKVRLNTRAQNIKLLILFIGIPIYVIITTFAAPTGNYTYYVLSCKYGGWDSSICKMERLNLILTLGYAVPILQRVIFINAVLLALVALNFGAEVGRGLVDSWITRFSSLRRLEYDATTATPDASSTKAKHTSVSSSSRDIINNSSSSNSRSGSSSSGNSNLENNMAVINTMHQQAPSGHPSTTAMNIPVHRDSSSPQADPATAIQYLQRDSYEHYLFIREYMTIGSRSWSPIIVTLSFLCVFYVLIFAYGAITVGNVFPKFMLAYYCFWIIVRVFILSIYPIMSLAHANSYAHSLQELFLVAAPEDFTVLGGRDGWLEYLDKVPAVWTVYGLWVTWDRLTGLLWTGVAGLGAFGITYASSIEGSR